METKLFEAALGIAAPWFVEGVEFDAPQRRLTIRIDFEAGSRFGHERAAGDHPVHDTQTKRYRHLNFFQHECFLEARVPRVKLPDGKVALVEPGWAGKLAGFTLLFEALVVMLTQQMPFAAVARLAGVSAHRTKAIAKRYVDLALAQADRSQTSALAIDETSCRRGHDYLTLAADADPEARCVFSVVEGRDAVAVAAIAVDLVEQGGAPTNIKSVSIDMSTAFISGVAKQFPDAQVTFDKFHVIAHASAAVDQMRRIEQKTDPDLKGLRWVLLKDRGDLTPAQTAQLEALLAQLNTKRTARAWRYREQLRAILDHRQINVAARLLSRWCSNVLRSKVEPMKEVARMIRRHFDGVIAWARTRQTNGFLEALNGLFQAAKRRARGYRTFETMRTVIFLIAGKLNFQVINPHAA